MRSTTQWGALLLGAVFLLVGVLGLVTPNGMAMNADLETTGQLLGLFPVNIVHNLVHLVFGAWGLAAARGVDSSRTFGRAGAAIYAVLVALAFISPTGFGLVPIGGNDIWLHAVLAVALAVVGFAGMGATRSARV